jgi:hypothetical protein
MEPKPIWGWILSDGKTSLASPKYYKMFQHLGDIVNLPNGRYSFMCYAGEGQYKNFNPHGLSSWSQGKPNVGTKFAHNVGQFNPSTNGVTLCSNFGSNGFEYEYTISGEHNPAEDRNMTFIIQNWDFEDGRMTYVNNEKVSENYAPHTDLRWLAFKDKFTVYYSETQSTKIEYDILDMAARNHFSMNCNSMAGIDAFRGVLHQWLIDNRDEGEGSAYYTQYEDDTKEGIYHDDGRTNADLIMEWYFDTMAGASDRALDIRKKGIKCKKLAMPEKCLKNGEWADDYVWPEHQPLKCESDDPVVCFLLKALTGRDTEAKPETIAEAKPKKKVWKARA